MIAILASRWDTTAQDIAAAWSGETVGLMTARDLSRVGWRQHLGTSDDGAESAGVVIEGHPIGNAEIRGVLTRLPWVTEGELPEIVATDRAYVAAEMSAFLLYWLSGLRCPVLNLPTPTCLSGPGWRAEHWARAAAESGMTVRAVQRDTRMIAAPVDLTNSMQVTVVGSRVFGEVTSELAQRARHLAQLAGVGLLTLRFAGCERDAEFLAADVFPSLDDESVRCAVLELFAGQPASRP